MKDRPSVFVIMPFDDALGVLYELGIKPACEAAGADCTRLDEQIFGEGMLDRIYGQILAADVVVAEMTAANRNVYYEAGYAHGLRKPVIFLTASADDIPFDLMHYKHLIHGGDPRKVRAGLEEQVRYYLENPDEVAERLGAGVEQQRMLAQVVNYLEDRDFTRISFEGAREYIDERWTDADLRELIDVYPNRLRFARMSEGRPGLKLKR